MLKLLYWRQKGLTNMVLITYSKVSIKRPVLLNDIKQPGPSQKKLILLFYFRAATANFWALDIWKESLLNDEYNLFFQILEA